MRLVWSGLTALLWAAYAAAAVGIVGVVWGDRGGVDEASCVWLVMHAALAAGVFLGALWGVWRRYQAWWLPRPAVAVAPVPLVVGAPATLAWRLTGGARRVTRLEVAFRCVEVITHREETETRTERRVLESIALHPDDHHADDGDAGVPLRGRAQFQVSRKARPTFCGQDHAIGWEVWVRLGGRGGGVVEETWPIEVASPTGLERRPAESRLASSVHPAG